MITKKMSEETVELTQSYYEARAAAQRQERILKALSGQLKARFRPGCIYESPDCSITAEKRLIMSPAHMVSACKYAQLRVAVKA